jgi:hypothetical protein
MLVGMNAHLPDRIGLFKQWCDVGTVHMIIVVIQEGKELYQHISAQLEHQCSRHITGTLLVWQPPDGVDHVSGGDVTDTLRYSGNCQTSTPQVINMKFCKFSYVGKIT